MHPSLRLLVLSAILPLALSASAPARAADCGEGMVCAGDPPSLIRVLEAGGYKPQWLRSKVTGNPMISGSANGYAFDIYFYGCVKNADCTSLAFSTTFRRSAISSAELANDWNRSNRFGQMAFDPDTGTMALVYDVTTKGGLTTANFADVLDWWVSTLTNLRDFFDARAAARAVPGGDEGAERGE
jgi:hypothetical protein